jgi:hypothetical protein
MTEAEWLASADPQAMLRCPAVSRQARKRRLFVVACCHRIGEYLTTAAKRAVEAAEGFADGAVNGWDLYLASRAVGYPKDEHRRRACMAARAASIPSGEGYDSSPGAAALAANVCGNPLAENDKQRRAECAAQAALLRDIFGNPFRPVTFSVEWRTDTAVSLARAMYDSRDFGAMPILADALKDVGCEDEAILNHCRDANQVHVRGCWVVDLVLGKE